MKKMEDRIPKWTVIDANAELSDEAITALARILLDYVRRQEQDGSESNEADD